MDTTRRDFLRGATATGLGLGLTSRLPLRAATPKRQAQKPLKLLILGGTGFLGPAIVRAALERGHSIDLFHRGRTRPDLFPDLPAPEDFRAVVWEPNPRWADSLQARRRPCPHLAGAF